MNPIHQVFGGSYFFVNKHTAELVGNDKHVGLFSVQKHLNHLP